MSLVEFPATIGHTTTVAHRASGVDVIALCDDYWRLAQRIASTEFVPKAFHKRPEAVLAALLSGAERGLGPMESLRSINVIEGRPSLSAEAMRALVFAAGHEIEIIETNAQRAVVIGRRAGSEISSPQFIWTMDRAKRARLITKTNWQSYPEAMLLARATADLCRALFPDVIAGLAVSEELGDELEAPPATATVRPPRRQRTAIEPARAAGVGADGAVLSPAGTDTPPPQPTSYRHDMLEAELSAADGLPANPEFDVDEIPGSDTPSWAPQPKTPGLDQRRFHAALRQALPDVDKTTMERYRHTLVAIVTRKRPDGLTTSSKELDVDEQLALSELVARLRAGTATIVDGPEAIEDRTENGWQFDVNLEPGHVGLTVTRTGGEVVQGELLEADDE
jgi:hypothetical protein